VLRSVRLPLQQATALSHSGDLPSLPALPLLLSDYLVMLLALTLSHWAKPAMPQTWEPPPWVLKALPTAKIRQLWVLPVKL